MTYGLTAMGSELQPALAELKSWARHWLAQDEERRRRSPPAVTHANAARPARRPYALRTAAASCSPSRSTDASRILNFWTLPVIVIGNSSTKIT